MEALFATERELIAMHRQEAEHIAAQRRAAAERRRLHDQALRATSALGLAPPLALPPDAPLDEPAAPKIVLCEAAATAVLAAAAGGTGVLLIDGRWMKSMLAGANHDKPTADLLSVLALGHPVPIDRGAAGTAMAAFPGCVLGALQPADCLSLPKLTAEQLVATVFVKAAPVPVGGDGAPLAQLMKRVREASATPLTLQLPGKTRQVLAGASGRWAEKGTSVRRPLADYLAALPDLARRLAGLFHLIEGATAGAAVTEITPTNIQRAKALIDAFVLPMAEAILAAASADVVERDARMMVAHLQSNTTPQNKIERRQWLRDWQRRLPHAHFTGALNLLVSENLLSQTEGEDNGQWYLAAPDIHKAGCPLSTAPTGAGQSTSKRGR
jgi:hypothetical protein